MFINFVRTDQLINLFIKPKQYLINLLYIGRHKVLVNKALKAERCYIGPFYGEFGHLLSHVLPFVSYLHKNGVSVKIACVNTYKPFFKDEAGNDIFTEFWEIRDFFSESLPSSNTANLPKDVKVNINRFIDFAANSKEVFFNISNVNTYKRGFVLGNHQNKYLHTYNLSQPFTKKETSVVIFPRNKNYHPEFQGSPINFLEIAEIVSGFADKVYMVGHPAMVEQSTVNNDKVEYCFSKNNDLLIEICSRSLLIINAISGTVFLGNYTHTDNLVVFYGDKTIPINFDETIWLNNNLGNSKINYVNSKEDLKKYLEVLNRKLKLTVS